MQAAQTIKIRLPKWSPKQAQITRSPAKRKVIVTGRRFGKTTLFARVACDSFLNGKKTLEAAPVTKQTNAFWNKVKRYLRPLTDAGMARKWENERIIEMGKGLIQAQTAYDADTLRGDWADLLLLDEYSYMDASAWMVVGAPMLLDTDGDAMFAFTPNRRNHAHSLYAQALADDLGIWQAFHGTSYDNPHLSPQALERLKSDMTEEMIRQEILAEFLENEGAVFRNIAACIKAPLDADPEAHTGHRIVAGNDWGKQNDYTCTSIGCATCKVELARDRFNKIDYVFQRGRLRALYEYWNPDIILAESNAMGEPIIEELQRDELPVVGFNMTASSKPQVIENLALALERTEWQFQADPIWTAELEAYERRVSPSTGRSQYSAPTGVHDDTVITRALMVFCGSQGSWVIW